MQKLMIFIDGNNLESSVNTLFNGQIKIDYEKFTDQISEIYGGLLQRFYYYTAQGDPKREPDKFKKTETFVNYLNSNINNCIAKTGYLKLYGKNSEGKDLYVEKGTDIHISIDMLSLAYNNAYDTAILVSADTDYLPVINMIRSIGKNVCVCVIENQKAGMIKSACDSHILLKKEDLEKVKR